MKFQLPPMLTEYSRIIGLLSVVVSTGLPVEVVSDPVILVFPPMRGTIAGVSWAVIDGVSGYLTEYTRTYEEEEAKSWTKKWGETGPVSFASFGRPPG
jgi:hypothetical protein